MRTIEDVRYDFNDQEKLQLADELAAAVAKTLALENEKSIVSSQLNSDIKSANSRVADLSRKVAAGFEMRPTEVLVVYNEPIPGMKRIINLATSRVIREEAMTDEERQQELDFSGGTE